MDSIFWCRGMVRCEICYDNRVVNGEKIENLFTIVEIGSLLFVEYCRIGRFVF